MNKYTFLPAVLATSVVGFGLISSSASAATLVPQEEGEIKLINPELPLIGPEVATPGFTVESLEDATTGTKSRLFVDKKNTANDYGVIKFSGIDKGTNDPSAEYWFRPVAMKADGITPFSEKGQLEVGTFKFDFEKTISNLLIDFLDVESNGTQILELNGVAFNYEAPISGNNSIFSYSLQNVKSIVLKLGNEDAKLRPGDGVNVQLETESVPEPGVTLGLSALALGGMLKLRRKQKEA